jgi:hypothetical protein
MLCVTDQPKLGSAFGRRVLDDWQLLHGRLPPLLVRYLLGGALGTLWSCHIMGARHCLEPYKFASPRTLKSRTKAHQCCRALLSAERVSLWPLCCNRSPGRTCPAADEGDWFVRLVAWLLWLRGNARGPWRLYVDLLPKVGFGGAVVPKAPQGDDGGPFAGCSHRLLPGQHPICLECRGLCVTVKHHTKGKQNQRVLLCTVLRCTAGGGDDDAHELQAR